MTVSVRSRPPEPSEYLEYYGRYVALVPRDDIVRTLHEQLETTRAFWAALPEARAAEPYAPGK